MADGWVSAASISVCLSLLSTYGSLVPSVIAITGKKYAQVDDNHSKAADDSHQPSASPLLQRSFRLEDFLWTGSGDGPDVDPQPPAASLQPFQVTTVFHTTTIVTTVHHTPPAPSSEKTSCTLSCLASIEPSESFEAPKPSDEFGATPSLHRTFPPEATPANPNPTSTIQFVSPSRTSISSIPESLPQYWLLTVLRNYEGNVDPILGILANRLSRLYKKAFMRQQEKHLGLVFSSNPSLHISRRASEGLTWRKPRALDPVSVHIMRISKKLEDGSDVELLYTVHVGGRPVLAKTAAEDMKLISDEEAAMELGYSVVTKAEPYLKDAGHTMPSSGAWKGHAWAMAIAAIVFGILVLFLAALLAYVAKIQRKKQRQRRLVSEAEPITSSDRPGLTNRRQVFETGMCTNLAYEGAEGDAKLVIQPPGTSKGSSWLSKHSDVFPAPSAPHRPKSTEIDPNRAHVHQPPSHIQHPVGETGGEEEEQRMIEQVGGKEDNQMVDSMRFSKRRHQKIATRRKCRPSGKVKLRSVRMEEPPPRMDPSPSLLEDLGASDGEQDWITSPLPLHKTLASPTSYLSMPSVRTFPQGAMIPEPLALVLESNRNPRDSLSVRHLDIYPEASAFEPPMKRGNMSRHSLHGSIDGEDPGVLGPKVFEAVRHQRELRRESSLLIGGSRGSLRFPDDNLILPLGEGARLRKRFHDLLDDTLVLFGKRYGEQTKTEKISEPRTFDGRINNQYLPPPGPSRMDCRSQSAYTRAEEPLLGYIERPQRPKTSMSRPSDGGVNAWSSTHRRSRIASAGPRGAWGPDSPITSGKLSSAMFTRPLSAGPFQHRMTSTVPHDSPPPPPAPSSDSTLVMMEAQTSACDPAIPLIQAIKAELRKFNSNDTPS